MGLVNCKLKTDVICFSKIEEHNLKVSFKAKIFMSSKKFFKIVMAFKEKSICIQTLARGIIVIYSNSGEVFYAKCTPVQKF